MTKKKKYTVGIIIISLALCVFVVSIFISDIRFLNNKYNVKELNQGLDIEGVQLLMAVEDLIKLPNVTLGDNRPVEGGVEQYYINSLKDYIITDTYVTADGGEKVMQIMLDEGAGSIYGIKLGTEIDVAENFLKQHFFKKSILYSNQDKIYYVRGAIHIALFLDSEYMEVMDTIDRISIDYIHKETNGYVPDKVSEPIKV